MQPSKAVRIVIVGGSVGGLAAAHEMRAVGVEAAVYERSAGRMEARGAGVVMQPEVEALFARLHMSVRAVSVELWERQQLHLHGRATRYEAPQLMTAWDTLYRALREPLAGVCYRLDSALRQVRVEGSVVTAGFADGYTTQGHFLVGADGIGSATRRLLGGAARPSYAGYVAWRGLEPEAALPGDLLELLTGRFTFFGSDGMQMLCYLVPGPEGELTEGSRRVNWVWYMNVPEPRPAEAAREPVREAVHGFPATRRNAAGYGGGTRRDGGRIASTAVRGARTALRRLHAARLRPSAPPDGRRPRGLDR
ncbi:FAD-dependent monooxygenase [Streptomyces sp. NPDC002476]|uniref:FAD binding domain-containing protein n=1 Tax=Streptomyces sp. NPDC002476 TaxID=3364648 RepID=UPI0036A6B6BE